jgi:hypothetical protein
MITVQRKVRLGQKGRKPKGAPAPIGRVPRVARLMALAIRFDQMIRDGVVADQAELARLGRVTRARLTQIMNLLALAPDIQEAVLLLSPVAGWRGNVTERQLRAVVALANWRKQRAMWSELDRPA